MRLGAFDLKWRPERTALDVAGWRASAKRAVPRMVWSYVESGAGDGRTMDRNIAAFSAHLLQQRVLSSPAEASTRVTVLGEGFEHPFFIAPTGLAGMVHWSGDIALARAAESAGSNLVLSCGSSYSLEEVATSTGNAPWFQLYPWGDRDMTGSLIRRAQHAGYGALFVTVDVPVPGNRVLERLEGMGNPPVITPRRAVDALLHPRWLAGLARHRRVSLANLAPAGTKGRILETIRTQALNMRPDLRWSDVAWMRDQWTGPLVIKGVMSREDAEQALAIGADGVVVSNHGGRQLSPTAASIEALAAIAEAVKGEAKVFIDGGIRTGSDAAVAIALGADAVLVGRPALYGLAAAGQRGVEAILRSLRGELESTLTLMGVHRLSDLKPQHVLAAHGLPSASNALMTGRNEK